MGSRRNVCPGIRGHLLEGHLLGETGRSVVRGKAMLRRIERY